MPDFITSVRDGGFYGWRLVHRQTRRSNSGDSAPGSSARGHRAGCPARVAFRGARAAVLSDAASSERIGLSAGVHNNAFVALHGSINRSKLSGYSIARVPFRNGRPTGPAENFLTGFIARDDDQKEAWGRPVGLLQLPDGSLLVSDDGGNRIWRVSYAGK